MRRIHCRERANWQERARKLGFTFHTIDGEKYWDETAFYAFSLREIETGIEDVANNLYQLCLSAVDRIVKDERLLRRLAIPELAWDCMARSWNEKQPSLYGRFDFRFDGASPAKLLEFNGDTPTSIYEAAVFQWYWLEDSIANGTLRRGTDQFNGLHEALVARFRDIAAGGAVHLASFPDHEEDRGTVAYLEECVRAAGSEPHFIAIADIGLTPDGQFIDANDKPIERLFKLYPWEWMWQDEFGRAVPACTTQFIEPPWKLLISNKGLLPVLWEMEPGHPNLLPAYFADDPRRAELGSRYAMKPLYSREGANVMLVDGQAVTVGDLGQYGKEGFVYQALAPLPVFDRNYPVIGAWIVGETCRGIGIREDKSPITKNSSRFLPHAIIG
ncbi:MAG: glutathionylspermidine synthase family protein [Beijerinckiaceae bacterium]